MTAVTPIKQSPLLLLQNAVNVCVAYEDKKNIAPESAQQQLGRIRGLIMQALAGLEEPSTATIAATRAIMRAALGESYALLRDPERTVRDAAAVVTHTALTWGIGDALEDATGTP